MYSVWMKTELHNTLKPKKEATTAPFFSFIYSKPYCTTNFLVVISFPAFKDTK